MNVLVFILLLFSFQLLASDGVAQRVSVNFRQAKVEDVIKELQAQADIPFLYFGNTLEGAKPVTLRCSSCSVGEVLEALQKDQPFGLRQDHGVWVIYRRPTIPPEQLTAQDPQSARMQLKGRIVDEQGTPVAGASIRIKGTDQGGISDDNGNFTLPAVSPQATLVITAVNITPFEYKLDGKPDVVIYAKREVKPLEEFVSTGYFREKRLTNVGNVAKVKGEDLQRQPVGNITTALIGRVAGVQVTQASGVFGRNNSVRVRGTNSISSGNDPLYVIDGVPFYNGRTFDNPNMSTIGASSPLNVLNISDVESVEILKDADATAIYGSRGANGVIRITTRRGRAGRTSVDINFNRGFSVINRKWKMLSPEQYYSMRREAFRNDSIATFPATAYDINGRWDTTRYTDWQKLLIGNTAEYLDLQGSLSGGDANTQFLLSAGFHRETSIYPGDAFDNRGSIHFNLNHTSSNGKFKADFSNIYSINVNVLPLQNVGTFLQLPPNAPAIYDSAGKINWEGETWTNPFSLLLRENKTQTYFFNSNLQLSYDLLPWLQARTNFGFTTTQSYQYAKVPKASFRPSFTDPATAQKGTNDIKSWLVEPQVSGSRNVGIGTIGLSVGATFMQQKQNSDVITGTGFASDEMLNNIQSANSVAITGITSTLYRYVAGFGRFNYNYKSKYLLNVTARRDGSSRFGPNKRFSNFGAIGVGWVFSEEKFIKNLFNPISYGKIRASYGVTGNDQITDYLYLDTYAPSASSSPSYLGITGLLPVRAPNANYAWERNRKIEAAIELGFLKDRILVTASYYRNRSSNLLLTLPLPSITGNTGVTANLPALVQNTGLEVEISSTVLKSKTLSWTANVNLTVPRNKLIDYPSLSTSSNADTYVIGEPLAIQKRSHFIGVNPMNGLYSILDEDKDGSITYPNDYRSIYFVGQQYFGGIQNQVVLRSFQLDVFFQFVKQKYGQNWYTNFSRPGTMNNQPQYVLERWQQPGQITSVQRFSNSNVDAFYTYSDMQNSDLTLSDASFVRLKNINFSYQLPSRTAHLLKLDRLQIYAQAQNVLTFTKYRGLDPETKSTIPPLRTISFGIKVGF